MVTVRDVVEVMEHWAPSSLAETWDNPGLMTGSLENTVTAAIVALDVTSEVLETARRKRATTIISHHPPIFKPLRSLTGSSLAVRVIQTAIREGITIFSSHTNLDQAPGGVSHAAAEKLGLHSVTPLAPGRAEQVKFITFVPPEYTNRVREAAGAAGAGVIGEYELCSFTVRGSGTYLPLVNARPFEGQTGQFSRTEEDRIEMVTPASAIHRVIAAVRAVHPYEEMAYDILPLANPDSRYGYGAFGTLDAPMDGQEFVRYTADCFGVRSMTFSGSLERKVHRVAVMGGSGGKYAGRAVAAGADAFITGDVGYHDYLEAGDSILLIDATHRATEIPVLEAIQHRLLSNLSEKIDITIDSGAVLPTTGEYGSIHRERA